MTRGIVHWLRKLEERSAVARESFSHLLRFIRPGGDVVSTLLIETGKPSVWTHLLPNLRLRARQLIDTDILRYRVPEASHNRTSTKPHGGRSACLDIDRDVKA